MKERITAIACKRKTYIFLKKRETYTHIPKSYEADTLSCASIRARCLNLTIGRLLLKGNISGAN